MSAFKPKRITLRDVAHQAGVAPSTVSYVINNTPGQTISSETRERVLQAVKDLGYIPDTNARTMRGGKSMCVGVVISKDLAVPRFAQTLNGIQRGLDSAGYSLLLCTNKTGTDNNRDYIRAFMERRIDGVIFLGRDNEGPDRASLAAVRQKKIPFVIYDCQMKPGVYSSVDLDYEGGARLLVERVLKEKPKRLLYLRPDITKAQEELREKGVREVLAKHPQTDLQICTIPVTLENLEMWDIRYSIGTTGHNNELTDKFIEKVRSAATTLEPGDAVVSSWSTWTDMFRQFCPNTGLVYAELANNGESRFAPGFYMRLPNVEIGHACAESLLRLLEGKPSEKRLLNLDDIIDTSNMATLAQDNKER